MRILLLTQIVPFPPDSGPKIKTYHVLRYLAQRHEIHLIAFSRNEEEEAHARELEALCASVTTVPLHRSRRSDLSYLARSAISGQPFLIERDNQAAMHQAVSRLIDRHHFDAVHADQLSMAQFAVDLPIALRILDEHNAVWTIVQRTASGHRWGARRALEEWEWRKLRRYEIEICRRFDRLAVVSEEDRDALGVPVGDGVTAKVIPIAVDTEHLRFQPRAEAARHLVSVATMFYPPNVDGVRWFAEQVFPMVRRAAPDVQFHIVGARPPQSIRRLARNGNGVVVTGYVRDLDPILHESAVLVVPVHSGSGMRVKILEAFARGIPVVSTPVGAEGIAATPGVHLAVADNAEEFAGALLRLLRDRDEANQMASTARALVETRYHWQTALVGLDELYGWPPEGSAPPSVARLVGSTSAPRTAS